MKNANLVDNLSRSGIDAHLDNGNSPVGIEITTLNSFVASWIFVERLTNLLDKHGYLEDKEIDVTYSHGRLYAAMQGKTIYDYIASAGKAILTGDEHTISQLELSVEMNEELRGLISFHINDPDKVPWFEYITDGLASRLREKSKARQLKKYSRNLVFVGLNHLSPSNWAFPDVFEDLGTNVGRFSFETNAIKDYWALHLPNLPNIVGICYFFYSLDREDPFYTLKIFWRNDYDCIAINL